MIYAPIFVLDTQSLSIEEIINQAVFYADDTREKLWLLSLPLSKRTPENTKYYCEKVVHRNPISQIILGKPFVYLELPESDTIPIDFDADESIIQNLLQGFVSSGYVTIQEIENIVNQVNLNRGNKVILYDYFPLFWKSQTKTHEELKLDGFFTQGITIE